MRCGWCQGPANTGLGVCSEGGFLVPRNTSVCPASRWFFDECPGTIHLVACRHCSTVGCCTCYQDSCLSFSLSLSVQWSQCMHQ